jgi:hypothetical protein
MALAPGVRIAVATVAAVGVVAGAYAAGRATAGDGERHAAEPVAVAGGEAIRPPRLGAAPPLPGMRAPAAPAPAAVADGGSESAGGAGVAPTPSSGGGSTPSTPSTTTPPPAGGGGGEVISEGGGVD